MRILSPKLVQKDQAQEIRIYCWLSFLPYELIINYWCPLQKFIQHSASRADDFKSVVISLYLLIP